VTYRFDPLQYPSLKRVWDAVNQVYVDQWLTESGFHMTLPDDRVVYIHPGFAFDKASVPRILHGYLNRDDSHVIVAALVHDYLYEYQQIENKWITRKEADQHFYGIIKQSGMRATKAWLAYIAVRMAGSRFFNPRAKRMRNPYYVERP
jgi:hypothetical protein